MNKKVIIIAIVLVILLIGIAIASLSYNRILKNKNETIKIDIIHESGDLVVGETIVFTISQFEPDYEVTWEMGSSIHSGKSFPISFEKSDKYHINVSIKGSKVNGQSSETVEIKNSNIYDELQNGIPLTNMVGPPPMYQQDFEILNGTTSPYANLSVNVNSGTGSVGLEIWLSNDESFEVIHSEQVSIRNNGHTFDLSIDLSNYESINKPYRFIFNLVMHRGYISGFSYEIGIEY